MIFLTKTWCFWSWTVILWRGKIEYFANYSASINSTQGIIFSTNKNSVSTISKPPVQKMVCYMMSVMSLLVSVVSQTKGKEEKQFSLQTLNL